MKNDWFVLSFVFGFFTVTTSILNVAIGGTTNLTTISYIFLAFQLITFIAGMIVGD